VAAVDVANGYESAAHDEGELTTDFTDIHG
jgi:hypothetical protein